MSEAADTSAFALGLRDTAEIGHLSDHSMIVIDCDAAQSFDSTVFTPLLSAVVVAVSADPASIKAPKWADILITQAPDAPRPWVTCNVASTVSLIEDTVKRCPRTAIALVQLLRMTNVLQLGHAIVAESLTYSMLQSGREFHAWLDSRDAHVHIENEGEAPVIANVRSQTLEITIHRPAANNAIDREVRDRLFELFTMVRLDEDIHQVIFNGTGRCFSVGGDLSEFGTTTDPTESHLIRLARSVPAAMVACAKPITVSVKGPVIGAGVELAAFAQRVISTESAHFRLPEVSMGLIPGSGGTVSVTRRIGRERTAYMSLTRRRIRASTAQSWGLVDELIS